MFIKSIAVLFAAFALGGAAFAQTQQPQQSQSCDAKAAEKKLAGAAKTSFVKKCERDMAAACETMAKEKKLSGAARNSFEKKCLKDAQG